MKSENSWKTKILLFFISQSVTLFGSTLVQMAVIWYVTLQTSRGIWVAAFSVCSYLPQFLLSFVGGVWADRYERKKMIAAADAGIAYSRSNNRIGRVLAIYGMFVLLCVPGGFLAGLFVNRIYGETYWYLTVTELAGFAGMTAGGILMGIWGGFQGQTGEKRVCGREKTLAVGLICFGLLSVGMGMAWAFPVYLLLMGFYGVALTTVQTAATVLLQENTEAWMQGRVLGLMQAVYAGSLPLGMAVFGAAADFLPMQGIMALGGAVLVGMGLWVEKQGIKGYNEKKK